MQLQLALAMSREEADAEETKKKSDDMRLTLAIQKSKADNSDKVGLKKVVQGEVPVKTVLVTAWCCSICSWWWFCSE